MTISGLATRTNEGADLARERTGVRWQNRAGTASSFPSRFVEVRTVEEAVVAVRQARRNGEFFRAVGAGRAVSGVAAAPGVLIDTTGLRGLVSIDRDAGTATFLAGTTVADADAELRRLGAAIDGAPADAQATLGGAVSTGSHSYEPNMANFSATVRGLTLVSAEGELLHVSATENAQFWKAAQLGLGALGVIVEVTVPVRPYRDLRINRKRRDIDELVREIPEARAKTDHYRVDWRPQGDRALLSVGWFEEPDAARTRVQLAGTVAADELNQIEAPEPRLAIEARPRRRDRLRNGLRKFIPFLTPTVNRVVAAFDRDRTPSERRGDAKLIDDQPLRVEYQFPVYRAAAIVDGIRELVHRSKQYSSATVRISLVAADDVWLSPAYGRDVLAVALQLPGKYTQSADTALRAAEDLFIALGGLPSWGDWNTMTGPEAAYVMPRYGDFLGIRDMLDPYDRTNNPAVARILG